MSRIRAGHGGCHGGQCRSRENNIPLHGTGEGDASRGDGN